MITVKIFPCNPFRELCYVVSDGSGEAVIVDCGACDEGERGRIEEYIAGKGLRPVMLVNTHGHIDHIIAVNRFKRLYGIPFAIDARESGVLASALSSAAMFGLPVEEDIIPAIDTDLSKESLIRFGDTVLEVLHTPGHSPGGVSLYHRESGTLFTGDTLFAGSIGRTDLPGGDYDTLMESIIKRILPLGGDVKIYPGHGNSSTLAHEAAYNPFVAEVLQGMTDTPERI
ncbi:MAG: MBL fold metallo-hydrolase [Rikenellaceae bacterium]|nr:MBL fold metallo-hydrolase [Rikenellaceae bacterium]